MSESVKVVVTKSKLDGLATVINEKAGQVGKKTIDQLKETVNGINTLNTVPIWKGGNY